MAHERNAKKAMRYNMFLGEYIKILVINIILMIYNDCTFRQPTEKCKDIKALWEKRGLYGFSSNVDTMLIIQCLLGYKGDTTLSVISGYTDSNKNREKIILASGNYNPINPVTKQLAALYSISALYHSDIYFCDEIAIEFTKHDRLYKTTNVEVLKNKVMNDSLGKLNVIYEYKTVYNEIIQSIYLKYESWFNLIKDIGLQEARRRKINPLDNNQEIRWVGQMLK